ncbi:phosphoribosylamine/glycine ligase [Melioribacter roseus P3M-2]|uniref:Phosphoribosylamine--glycine ligase n=1 Tax=Melioribacter roseus (strain DSM 23840 / JCM 17771 / VKM B-2668 / P3M-2) TaxID=1191523 RepID=I7A713_MELRP|nr:phosphoribosylamine--glycine ligase [Melioribacter roseus]AFN75671.1 phosphoribosylamine/glycine ligase [Melioribacter roseus P3M-2]
MKVAVIGAGGREHALALKISRSPLLEELFIIPGNPGTKKLGSNIQLNPDNNDEIVEFCLAQKIELAVVGPEKPLTNGLADALRSKGIKVFGPDKNAARIEGEKSFAKKLMQDFNIPTADFKVFAKDQYRDALEYLENSTFPAVIKADGIAAGKGVVIADNFEEAKAAVDDCFLNSAFGSAGDKVVIEEFMTGQEASVFAITDGKDYVVLPAAQDHKRIGEGDTGKNTGGMGAYAPTPFVDDDMMKKIEDEIIKPTIDAMRETGNEYIGCLYCGLMLTPDGPKVVEYNCRFGDPETQAVLPLLQGDFLKLLYTAASGAIDKSAVSYTGGSSVCVVAASKGYPGPYEKGKEIRGLDIEDPQIIVYHAGTIEKEGRIYTNGGRVLNITSVINENSLIKAKQKAYEGLTKIFFDGIYYRKDIADKALKNRVD